MAHDRGWVGVDERERRGIVQLKERTREIRDFELPVDKNFNATPGTII